MFKLKPGNVFQKLNKMDKKQAYTWGAIVLVCFIALITLASFMGKADEASFEDFNTRGYDLAQMPFLNDEAEEYLLASKYPDMKDNNSTLLYSAAEKEARQEEDAAKAETESSGQSEESYSSDGGYSRGGYSGGGYSGRGGGSGAPTEIGQLGSASMGRAGGGGVSATWGAPRGDFSTFKSQDKGTETPMAQLKNKDARRALAQFAQTSRAAAGLRDGKAANAKRALMGGHIEGSEAFTDEGIDLSKAQGLAIDPNGDFSSDFKGIADAVKDAANAAKDAKEEFKEEAMDPLLQQLLSGLINLGMNALGNLIDTGIDAAKGAIAANAAGNQATDNVMNDLMGTTVENMTDAQKQIFADKYYNGDVQAFTDANKGKTGSSIIGDHLKSSNGNGFSTSAVQEGVSRVKGENGTTYSYNGKDDYPSKAEARKAWKADRAAMNEFRDYVEDNHLKSGSSDLATYYQNARADARAPYTGNRSGYQSSPTGTNSGTDGKSNRLRDVLNDTTMTQTEKVRLLRENGLSNEAACLQVYGNSNC
ncbi:MAG: hypothetical protein IJP25_06110 [Elusimicrobiaceae bacterium]|nr:hypothetical protein [Elusimicrobiaceae bacterium]